MVSKLPNTTWPKGAFVETVKVWQHEWFYITEPRGARWAATPEFRSGSPMRLALWTNKGLDWGSTDEVMMLQKRVKNMINKYTSLTDVIQGWTAKAERIKCPAPLSEDPADPLLTRMLVPVPYQASEKKAKKKGKEAKGGLRRKDTSDAVSGETEAHSSHEGDEDEEKEEAESDSPLKGKKKKRAASTNPEEGASKREKITLSDDSDTDAEHTPWPNRSAAEVETHKIALAQAKEEAKASKVAADNAAADLKSEHVAHRQYGERVTEVEQELKDAAAKCGSLEEKNKAQEAKLAKALQEAKEARTESGAAHEEIR
nr:uncharacterized protein LOC120965041 [Aegilops tauschii subsp. strangulata]